MASTPSLPPPDFLIQIGTAFMASKTLGTAVSMGLFTELSKSPLSLENIREKFQLHPRGARDFLDALVALKLLERDDEKRLYSNSAVSDHYLDSGKLSYIGGFLAMINDRLYDVWGKLHLSLQDGKRRNADVLHSEKEEDLFSALYADPQRLKGFLSAMTGISQLSNTKMATSSIIPWANYKTFSDVGTAQGDLAVQIAISNPHLRGIGFDLPQTKDVFEEYVNRNALSDRVVFQGGDFFAEPLPSVDVITMGHILHDWPIETKKMLVGKAFDALPEGGAFVIYESFIDDERKENVAGLLMSLNMLVETEGGFDYSPSDCIVWLKDAGFKEFKFERTRPSEGFLVAFK